MVFLASSFTAFADNTLFHWQGAEVPVLQGGSIDKPVIKLTKNEDNVKQDYYAIQVSPKGEDKLLVSLNENIEAGDTLSVTGFIRTSKTRQASLEYTLGTNASLASNTTLPNLYYDEDYNNSVGKPSTDAIVVSEDFEASKSIEISSTSNSETSIYITDICVKKKIIVPSLTFMNPEAGSLVALLNNSTPILFATNFDKDCKGFKVSIIDSQKKVDGKSDATVYEDFTTTKSENKWELPIYGTFELIKNRKYEVVFEGHQGASEKSEIVNTVSSYIIGNGNAYDYSTVSLSSVTPSDNSIITSVNNRVFNINFSDEVNIDNDKSVILDATGNKIVFASITSPDNKSWTLSVPENVLSECTSSFSLLIYAKDKNDLVVKGNEGDMEDSHFKFTYKCYLGCPNVTVNPQEGKVEQIKDITYSLNSGIQVVEDNDENNVTLYKEDKTSVVYKYQTRSLEDGSAISEKTNAITEDGTYYLHIPAGKFLLGEESYPNQELWVKYEIANGTLPSEVVSVTPEMNTELDELSTVTVRFSDYASPRNGAFTPKVYDAAGYVVATARGECPEDYVIKFTLSNTIRKAGTYKLVIPAEGLIMGDMGDFLSKSDITLTFKVKEGAEPEIVVTAYPSNNSILKSLSEVAISFDNNKNADAVKYPASTPALYKDGIKIKDVSLVKGAFWNRLIAVITNDDEPAITEPGTYTLEIPAGNVRLDGSFNYDKDLTFTYVVDPTSGIDFVTPSEEKVVKVYNMQGILVRKAHKTSAFKGLKGLYIVNGKKIILN